MDKLCGGITARTSANYLDLELIACIEWPQHAAPFNPTTNLLLFEGDFQRTPPEACFLNMGCWVGDVYREEEWARATTAGTHTPQT